MANIEERVETLVSAPISDLGYQLYDVIYVKEGKDWYLRIFIDSSTGISLEDCEKVNNAIEGLLDDANLIKEQYFLEVSSCGVEKVLRKDWHLQECIGQMVTLSLFKPIDGKKEITGTLTSFDENVVTLEELSIERKDISIMKKYYDWGN